MPPPTWFLYILRCRDGSLYTGIATDVERRFEEHQSGSPKSAKYTRGKRPLELVYQREIGTRSEATKEELRIKALSRSQKLAFILPLQAAGQTQSPTSSKPRKNGSRSSPSPSATAPGDPDDDSSPPRSPRTSS